MSTFVGYITVLRNSKHSDMNWQFFIFLNLVDFCFKIRAPETSKRWRTIEIHVSGGGRETGSEHFQNSFLRMILTTCIWCSRRRVCFHRDRKFSILLHCPLVLQPHASSAPCVNQPLKMIHTMLIWNLREEFSFCYSLKNVWWENCILLASMRVCDHWWS